MKYEFGLHNFIMYAFAVSLKAVFLKMYKGDATVLAKKTLYLITSAIIIKFIFASAGFAYQVTERLEIGFLLAGALQYQRIHEDPEADGVARGAVPFQPELSFQPVETGEFFVKLGFAAGDGLNDGTSPFILAHWAADLASDVKNIHGRGRDYLLTAWYKHAFMFNHNNVLEVTGGIIDATDYLDENAFANDEYTQFMNEALVNSPNGFAPSYDFGVALEWRMDQWTLKGVGMNIGENEDGNNTNFFGVQLGYETETAMGEGNYRFIYEGSPGRAFSNPGGTSLEARHAFLISFDQEFGRYLGGWIRFGFQSDRAAVTYDKIYSGGLNLSGALWGRPQDNMGIAYGYLGGGNTGVRQTHVAEAYVRFAFMDAFGLTLDLQHMRDSYDADAGNDAEGFIAGIRFTVEF